MKKILYTLFLGLMLTGCYNDEGDYDYIFGTMNEIELDSISFSPQSYESLSGTIIEIQQPMVDTLIQRVQVSLKQTIAQNYDNLDFLWTRDFIGKDDLGNAVQIKDTITTPGYVDLEFLPNEARTYALRLVITDRTTSLKYYKSLTVKTRPIYKNSLFVLHGNNVGERKLGNIEIIGDIPNITIDAYKNVNPNAGTNPFAEARMLDFTAGLNSSGERYFRTLGVFYEDGKGKVWEPYGLTQKYAAQASYVFVTKWGAVMPKRIIGLGNPVQMQDSRLLIERNGTYYVAGSYFNFIPYNNKISSTVGHQTDFSITMGTIMANYYVLWDSKNERFLYQLKVHNMNGYSGESKGRTAANATVMNPLLDACVDFSNLPEGYSPKGKDAVYAYISSMGNDYNSAYPFFIFADDEMYYLYELKPLFGDKDSQKSKRKVNAPRFIMRSSDTDPAFTITARQLPSLQPGENASSICYSFFYSTNYIFFIDKTGKAVYRYNTMNDELYTVYEAPAQYTITKIKFRSSFASDFQKDLGRYLSIALDNGKNGAVTEVRLDNTGDVDTSFPVMLYEGTSEEKFGTIIDMQFVHDYLND